jgi:hypothetical protein
MNGSQEQKTSQGSARIVKIENGTLPKKTKKVLTQKRLKDVIHYDPETGVFTWVKRPGVRGGSIAGTTMKDGYRRIKIDGRGYLAHRLAVLYMEGYIPELTVDHIWRDRADNRYSGLREATYQCQTRNCGMCKNNTSGIKGVHWSAALKKWAASIRINNKLKHLGFFYNIIDAAYARYAGEQCLGFQDCDINSSAKQYIERQKDI